MELTYVMFATEDGWVTTGPAVMIEGQLWLVPKWREQQDEPYWRPAHAIRLPMEHVKATPDRQDCHWLLSGLVPTRAMEGQSAVLEGALFEVAEAPEWKVPIPELQ